MRPASIGLATLSILTLTLGCERDPPVGETAQALTGIYRDCTVAGCHGFDQSDLNLAVAQARAQCVHDGCDPVLCQTALPICPFINGRSCRYWECTGNGFVGQDADEVQAYLNNMNDCESVNGNLCQCAGVVCDCVAFVPDTPPSRTATTRRTAARAGSTAARAASTARPTATPPA